MKVHVVFKYHTGHEGYDLFGAEVYSDSQKANDRIAELSIVGCGDNCAPEDADVEDAFVIDYEVIE